MQKYTVEVNDDGDVYWYKHGTKQLHRTDGPAVEYANGTKHWYQNDQRHRIDGPAVEWANGNKWWYIEGKNLSEKEFLQQTSTCNGKVIEYEGKKYKLQLVKE